MLAIAVLTAGLLRAVMENRAPARGGAARGVRRALPEPGRDDHRRRQWAADRREQRVEALHPGVAVAGALLGVAVRGFHGVVDIDIGDLVRPGQQRTAPGQLGQLLAGDSVELK